jgi:hypothetical protein
MIDDLVKRLRESCYLAFEDGTNDYSSAIEAADRIEQLEAALQWVVDTDPAIMRSADFHADCNCHRCAMDNARAALEGNKDD